MSIDRTIEQLEAMGYFGQLDENLGQRLANGWNNMLAKTFGNNRAAGKLDVGTMVIGLEKEYKQWLGANGISNPTRGDFNKFLGLVQTTYGVKFGANGVEQTSAAPAPAAQPAQAAQPAAAPAASPTAPQPASPAAPAAPASAAPASPATTPGATVLTAENPTVTLTPGGTASPAQPAQPAQPASPLPSILDRTFTAMQTKIKANQIDQAGTTQTITKSLDGAKRMGQLPAAIQHLEQMAQSMSGTHAAQWITDAIKPYRGQTESRNTARKALSEAADMNEPFSIDQAREVFQNIARYSYNNANGAGNPAAAGATAGGSSSTGGAAAGGDGEDTSAPEHTASGGIMNVRIDESIIDRLASTASFDADGLRQFVQQNMELSPLAAGRELTSKGVGFHLTPQNVFAALFIFVRAIEQGK